MKIYTIEKEFDDNYDQSCTCVCATVDLNTVIAYINNNPLDDACFSYTVCVFDGFTGTILERTSLSCYTVNRGITEIKFRKIK
ncbi:hypothetical protein AVU18_gp080 [Citrobacter phage IME-CF2]|uniref:Uncharacterized protein n=3 Tax=Pseudotevenvirus TaxID=2842979 RepID=A0A1B1IXT8_9CAUD|nr:hypothetical protein CPTMiller_00123 [Citrobacter phage Miller]YP_009218618.1 hypothetical protein AVU18_gp080 [Citrobacter phage IME-CF2]YP_009285659.1 hypothetical protein BI032_gp228 [Citrobacter phage vB_CfrM_CfP1]AIK68059.1 hypothetical protein CPTMiller_00123 [Citrobacter phage Miller]AKR15926.1 hypothetical protein [Citrobacter phage IME-CF2]ANS06145.1 hypothetical protein ABCD_0121 [Citrobacter phage vB_CfrM_CfP1]